MTIFPDWPAPSNVVALSTTRRGLDQFGGASTGRFQAFNLGDHVGDDPAAVAANRQALVADSPGLVEIRWLQQIHCTRVWRGDSAASNDVRADAAISATVGEGCCVMTADCLPVLFCDRHGHQVAAAHAGWRGLCDGVLTETVAAFSAPASDLLAWMGPAISARHFEVGPEVREAFLAGFTGPSAPDIDLAFTTSARAGHYFADLYRLATMQLRSLGVGWVGGGEHCTFGDASRFYSYRRDGICGRQASLIYLQPS